jgi:hypothetical protein
MPSVQSPQILEEQDDEARIRRFGLVPACRNRRRGSFRFLELLLQRLGGRQLRAIKSFRAHDISFRFGLHTGCFSASQRTVEMGQQRMKVSTG